MKRHQQPEITPDRDDTTGYRIREPREVITPPPYDHNGGLFPYDFLRPTISDGYLFPNGDRYPY